MYLFYQVSKQFERSERKNSVNRKAESCVHGGKFISSLEPVKQRRKCITFIIIICTRISGVSYQSFTSPPMR